MAVERRQHVVHKEYHKKAGDIDRDFNDHPDDAAFGPANAGPVKRKLAEFGRIRGLAVGAFGEVSSDVGELTDRIAYVGAKRNWREMGCGNEVEARGQLKQMIRHKVGIEAVRGNANLLLDRVSVVCSGRAAAEDARQRRAQSHFGWKAQRDWRSRMHGFARSKRFNGCPGGHRGG
jgi:hypothetical protein